MHIDLKSIDSTFIKIAVGVIVLLCFIRIGIPFEFKNNIVDSFLRTSSFALVFVLIYKLFKLNKFVRHKGLRIISLIFISVLCFLFILGAIWNNILRTSDSRDWYNFEICSNSNGKKILRQIRETSGSIYDYRDRLVIFEFNKENRISININFEKYKSNCNCTALSGE